MFLKAPNGRLTNMGMVRKGFGNIPLKDVTMERKKIEEFEESIMFFSRVSLSKFSLKALYISWV